jgi:hypothetical protein
MPALPARPITFDSSAVRHDFYNLDSFTLDLAYLRLLPLEAFDVWSGGRVYELNTQSKRTADADALD